MTNPTASPVTLDSIDALDDPSVISDLDARLSAVVATFHPTARAAVAKAAEIARSVNVNDPSAVEWFGGEARRLLAETGVSAPVVDALVSAMMVPDPAL